MHRLIESNFPFQMSFAPRQRKPLVKAYPPAQKEAPLFNTVGGANIYLNRCGLMDYPEGDTEGANNFGGNTTNTQGGFSRRTMSNRQEQSQAQNGSRLLNRFTTGNDAKQALSRICPSFCGNGSNTRSRCCNTTCLNQSCVSRSTFIGSPSMIDSRNRSRTQL